MCKKIKVRKSGTNRVLEIFYYVPKVKGMSLLKVHNHSLGVFRQFQQASRFCGETANIRYVDIVPGRARPYNRRSKFPPWLLLAMNQVGTTCLANLQPRFFHRLLNQELYLFMKDPSNFVMNDIFSSSLFKSNLPMTS